MKACPYCQSPERQVKNGLNPSGSQRYRCQSCQRTYTPEPALNGYDEQTRLRAIQLYADGVNLRRIGRVLGVNYQSVANWVRAHVEQLPPEPVPNTPEVVELDELFTFIGEKKTKPM
jgi:transposase-like protein